MEALVARVGHAVRVRPPCESEDAAAEAAAPGSGLSPAADTSQVPGSQAAAGQTVA